MKSAFIGKKEFYVIKMHGTTIQIINKIWKIAVPL